MENVVGFLERKLNAVKPAPRQAIRNYLLSTYEKKGKEVETKVGLVAPEIRQLFQETVGDWPRRIGKQLFILNDKSEIIWLEKKSDLFGWLSGLKIMVDWDESVDGAISREDYLSYLRQSATNYSGIATLPHFPPIENTFYVHEPLPLDDGQFERFLDHFKPASEIDRTLLRAAFLTLFWGGAGGSRPAFVLTGEATDEKKGRGVGKTTLTEVMAKLTGGAIDFGKKTGLDDAKKRLLTARGERVVRFDNIKSNRFSNGDVESLITIPHISGHLMYVGEGKIENNFTYLFTFNEVSFSKDMAQRAIPITLKRPDRLDGNWDVNVDDDLRKNRLGIIAGIIAALQAEPRFVPEKLLRFGRWTQGVLTRATDDPKIISQIEQLQEEGDDESAQADIVAGVLEHNLRKYTLAKGLNGGPYEPGDPVMVRRSIVHQWIQRELGRDARNLSNCRRLVLGIRNPTFTCTEGMRHGLWYYRTQGTNDLKTFWLIEDDWGFESHVRATHTLKTSGSAD